MRNGNQRSGAKEGALSAEREEERGEKRRGRRASPQQTAATRRFIVEAATRTFLARGFAETRMIDVARAAGVAKGTLYLYFDTKEALFEGVLSEGIGQHIARMVALDPAEGQSVKAFLEAHLVPLAGELEGTGRADLMRLMVREGGRFPALTETYRRLVIEPARTAMARWLERAYRKGELRCDALSGLPQLIVAPVLLATIWNGLFTDERIDAADALQRFIDLTFVTPPEAG